MLFLQSYKYPEDGNDWLPAMNRAVAASVLQHDEEIWLPTGNLRFSGPVVFSSATVLRGSGSVGSNLAQGTVLQPDFDGADFLTWTGATSYKGTGGALESVIIAKAVGKSGGAAIKLTGTGPSNRAGYFKLSRVFVYSGSDAGVFDVGLLIDGSAITTPGAQGVRDISFDAVMFAGCQRNAAEFINAVHVVGSIQTAAGSNGTGNVLIDGGSQNIQMNGRIWGTLTLLTCKEVLFSGLASARHQSANATKCAFVHGDLIPVV